MSNLYFPICALFLSLALNVIFFSKKAIKNRDTELFKFMLIASLIDAICNTINITLAYKCPTATSIIKLINKIDFIQYIIWASSFSKYIYYISTTDDTENNLFFKFIKVFSIGSIILIAITPMKLHNSAEAMFAYGMCANVTYISSLVLAVLTLFILFFRRKTLINKKYAPIFVLLVFTFVIFFLNKYAPQLIVIPIIISYINLIMFFTIENPDVKMLTEVEMAREKAEKANVAKTDFLSSMSHEIRTPLNAIVGFSGAIEQETTLEAAKEDAKDIILASQNLLEIVNGILDISKLEANKVEIKETEYDLKEACEELIKLVRPRIGEKPIDLVLFVAPDVPRVLYGDKNKIKEILSNLLTNAVKYTESGKIECQVNCINKNDESSLIISVEDTGRGIKPEKIDKLFNKFERLDEDRNTTIEGSGLGLAITKKLVELMNGKIVVQSVFGEGSKFTFYVKQKISKNSNLNIPDQIVKKDLTFNNKKVLIVDDNSLNIKIASRLLTKYNINVSSCETGFDCIEMLKQNPSYDLVLMDDMMPKMTGTETLHILKEIPSFNTKVVVLTANAIDGMKEKYLEEGFDDYLAKPIEIPELERVLNKFLNKEITPAKFEPLPDSMYEITDEEIEKINEVPETSTEEINETKKDDQ